MPENTHYQKLENLMHSAPIVQLVGARVKISRAQAEIILPVKHKLFHAAGSLHGATVTGDALHCEHENMQLVIENDGDFLFQLKGNQPTALTEAQRITAAGSPLLPAKQKIAGTVG